MDMILDIFTTREIAFGFWSIIFCAYFMLWSKTRIAILQFVKNIFQKKILIFIIILTLYIVIILISLMALFSSLQLWRIEYAKVILLWGIFVGVTLCSNAIIEGIKQGYFINNVIDGFRFTVFVEYLIGLFTFNLIIEIILLPFFTSLFIIYNFSESKEEYSDVKKFIIILLGLLMLVFLVLSSLEVVNTYTSLNSKEVLIEFLIPIILSIIFVPLIFFFAIYSKYEQIYIQMQIKNQIGENEKRYNKWKVFLACLFSYKKLCRFQRNCIREMYSGMSNNQFNEIIENFKNNT